MHHTFPSSQQCRRFYSSRLGRMAFRVIRKYLGSYTGGYDRVVLGVGYAMPYLSIFKARGHRVLGVVPVEAGAVAWPENRLNAVCAAYTSLLPIADKSVDVVIVAHVLEHSAQYQQVIKEVARVLKPGGVALFLVPNVMGFWGWMRCTPFAGMRRFFPSTMCELLKNSNLRVIKIRSLLGVPPLQMRFLLRFYYVWEWLCMLLPGALGGILVVEARKEEFAFIREFERNARAVPTRAVPALEGARTQH